MTFELERSEQSAPLRYGELARALGVEAGAGAPLAEVRDAVLALRRGKGMVLDAADHDTWSAGSFFTNPILDAAAFAALEQRAGARAAALPRAGRARQDLGRVADRARRLRAGRRARPVALSSKHALALTNRGGASTAISSRSRARSPAGRAAARRRARARAGVRRGALAKKRVGGRA